MAFTKHNFVDGQVLYASQLNAIEDYIASIETGSQTGGSTGSSTTYYTQVVGAVGNGVTDDAKAIQDAIDAAGTQGLVILPAGKVYAIKSPIKLTSGYQTLICYGSIKQLTANTDAIQVNSSFNRIWIKNLVSAGNGITFGNGYSAQCNDCYIMSINSDKVGVLLNCIPSTPSGRATWMQYNSIRGNYITSRDSSIRLYIDANCPVQTYTWINDNRFYDFFCMAQTTNPSIDIDNECSSTVDICNNNRFENVSVEFSSVTTSPFSIRLKNTLNNEFHGFRSDEVNKYSCKVVKFEGLCKYNRINCSLCDSNHVDISGATSLVNNQIHSKYTNSPSYLLVSGTTVTTKTM